MTVRDILKAKNRDTITINRSDNILVAMKHLIDNKISCLPVVDGDRLIGIISDKDIFKAVYEHQDSFVVHKVEDLMQTNLIVGVEDDTLDYISGLMTNNRIRHIPVVDRERIIGLVSIGDVVKARETHMKIENRYLQQYIDGSYPG